MTPDPDALRRSTPCPDCGEMMLWTQNAWPLSDGVNKSAAYRCLGGHTIDPETTRGCPACGVHDTRLVGPGGAGETQHTCNRCAHVFSHRPPA